MQKNSRTVNNTIEQKFAVNSSVAPNATWELPIPMPKPPTHSGGTRAMPIAVPAAAATVSEL